MTSISGIKSDNLSGVIPHLLTEAVSSNVLSGLCKIAGFEILRHGTTFSSYRSITQLGGDPKYSGKATEASGYGKTHTFYVFRDTKLEDVPNIIHITMPLIKRGGTLMHSTIAYYNEKPPSNIWMKIARAITSFVKACFTPKVKFVYAEDEFGGIFYNDRLWGGVAFQTSHMLPPDRIGLLGFFNHVNKKRAWTHFKANPGRVALGVVQLGIGILLTGTGLGLFT